MPIRSLLDDGASLMDGVRGAIKSTAEVGDKLRAIVALCENPHFDTSRKYRIAELALEAIAFLSSK